MDAPTKALIEVIGDSGYTVQLHAANGHQEGTASHDELK